MGPRSEHSRHLWDGITEDRSRPLRALLFFMLVATLALGALSLTVHVAFCGISTGNPLVTAGMAFSRFVIPSARSNSWAPMLQALDFARGPDGNHLDELLVFKLHQKFQYAPASLLPLDSVSNLFAVTPLVLDWLNSAVFVGNSIACTALLRETAGLVIRSGTRRCDL